MPLIGNPKKIATTTDNFKKMLDLKCLLVDKTYMIKEFWESQCISLITRPRRFGKSLNLSMLQHFFAAEVANETTTGLFDQLAIATEKDKDGKNYIAAHQGKYPVIFITFKDVGSDSLEKTKTVAYTEIISNLKILMRDLYNYHKNIAEKLDAIHKNQFNKYRIGEVDNTELEKGLYFLSKCLHEVYGKKVIVLVDEYDSPFSRAYNQGCLDEFSDFFSRMLSNVFKANPHLEKGLIVGIFQLLHSKLLSGLNNSGIYLLFDKKYDIYFGFTEDEVQALMQARNSFTTLEDIRNFYKGYTIGGTIVYNPWAVMKCLDKDKLAPYWVTTSNDKLLPQLLTQSDSVTKTLLGELMHGKTITGKIDINLRYEDLIEKSSALWTLLLFCGYLTAENHLRKGSWFQCQLKIPNTEILEHYREVFSEWLREKITTDKYDSFLKTLVEGRVEEFTKLLTAYLLACTSSHDFQAEADYHSFMLGLLSSIRETHFLFSNKEAAIGRPDCLLLPKNQQITQGIILEFKHIHFKNKQDNKDIEQLKQKGHYYAELGLDQITVRGYSFILAEYPYIKSLLKVSIGFSNRLVSSAYTTVPIEGGEEKIDEYTSAINFADAIEKEYPKNSIFEKPQKTTQKNLKKRSGLIKESDDESMLDFEDVSTSKIPKRQLPFSSPNYLLDDTHWYVEDEINTLLQHSCRANTDIELLTAMLGTNWIAGNTLADQLQQFNEKRQELLANKQIVKNKIIIPVNLGDQNGNGMHWVLLFIKFANDNLHESLQILYFDPFGNPMSADVSNNLIKADIYNNANQIIYSKVKLQHDGYNCGPWIVAVANYLVTQEAAAQQAGISFDINGALLHLDQINIDKIRQKQLQIITNHLQPFAIRQTSLSTNTQTNFFQSVVYRPDFNNPDILQKQIQEFEAKKWPINASALEMNMDDEIADECELEKETTFNLEDNLYKGSKI